MRTQNLVDGRFDERELWFCGIVQLLQLAFGERESWFFEIIGDPLLAEQLQNTFQGDPLTLYLLSQLSQLKKDIPIVDTVLQVTVQRNLIRDPVQSRQGKAIE